MKASPGKRRIAIIASGVLVLAILAVVFWPGPKEPEYQGKKLTQWAEVYWDAQRGIQQAEFEYTEQELKAAVLKFERDRDTAREIVIRLGTNSIPWLVKRLTYETPVWRVKLLEAYVRIPGARKRNSLARAIRGETSLERRARVHMVFGIVREHGKSAVAELDRILGDPRMSAEAKDFAAQCLNDVAGLQSPTRMLERF